MNDKTITPPAAEEFASVTIEINHLNNSVRDDGKLVVGTVWSTENAVQAVFSQLDYFGISEVVRDAEIFSLLADARDCPGAFVLTVERPNGPQTNVICDVEVWQHFLTAGPVNEDGTVMGAISSLIMMGQDLRRTAIAAGASSLLQFYRFEAPKVEA